MPPLDVVCDRERPEPAAGRPCASCQQGKGAFCAGLDRDELKLLLAIMAQSAVGAADTIFREGDPARSMFSVAVGRVKLYKLLPDGRRQIFTFLFPGDFFGLANDHGYAYTAEALTPVVLCRYPRQPFERLLERVPRLERRLLEITVAELRAAQDHMVLLGRKSAREKVASFLVAEASEGEARGQPAGLVALPMCRTDIADYLGLTIETVSRTVTGFKREGIIALPDSGHIQLCRPDEMRQLAEGV